MQQARQIIYDQEFMPLGVKRSAWDLYQHEMQKPDSPTPGRVLKSVLKWMRQQKAKHDAAMRQLTPMQKQILRLMVEEGLTQKEVALRLGLKHITIRHHMKHVRKRIGAASIYQVIAVAVEMGWINSPKIHD